MVYLVAQTGLGNSYPMDGDYPIGPESQGGTLLAPAYINIDSEQNDLDFICPPGSVIST